MTLRNNYQQLQYGQHDTRATDPQNGSECVPLQWVPPVPPQVLHLAGLLRHILAVRCQQPGPEDSEAVARGVRLRFLKLVVEVDHEGGEDGAWEEGRELFATAEAETAPAQEERQSADGGEEGVDVVNNDVAGGGGVVVSGGMMP
ncbi:MAG: hypothetical protein Q9187_008324, partial [Circinaria calcarea]